MAFDYGAFTGATSDDAPLITNPYDPLNIAGRDLPDWFTPLPITPKRGRSRYIGRTVPKEWMDSLRTVDTMEVQGAPSINLYLDDDGAAVVSVTRKSKYWEYFLESDKQRIWQIQEEMFHAYQAFSNGSYSLRMLAGLGHPYGYGRLKVPGTERYARRRVPRRAGKKSLGYVSGIRGSVPTMSIVNRQTGLFYRSWRTERVENSDGYTLKFINSAKSRKGFPYAWGLAVGTRKMQPHGPWTEVATKYLKLLNSAHMRAISRARNTANAMDSFYFGGGN